MFPTGNTPLGLALNEVITPFSSFSLLNFAEQKGGRKKKKEDVTSLQGAKTRPS